jgi:hypothetical protein
MWFDWTNYWVKMVLTLAIFRQLIALKGLWKVFENRQKKSLKVFDFFWSWRLRTLLYVLSKKSMLPFFVTTLRSSMKLSHFLSDFYCKKALQLWITKNARPLAELWHVHSTTIAFIGVMCQWSMIYRKANENWYHVSRPRPHGIYLPHENYSLFLKNRLKKHQIYLQIKVLLLHSASATQIVSF